MSFNGLDIYVDTRTIRKKKGLVTSSLQGLTSPTRTENDNRQARREHNSQNDVNDRVSVTEGYDEGHSRYKMCARSISEVQ